MDGKLNLSLMASVLVFATACGSSSSNSELKILGGSRVADTDIVAQSTVSLSVEKPDGGYISCSGTLIDPLHVLTAAHCLDTTSGLVLVSLKNLDRRNTKNFVHPNYRRDVLMQQFPSTAAHDIAVIRLSKAFQNGTPALIPQAATASGISAVVAGFGESENRDNTDLIKMIKSISFSNSSLMEFGTNVSGGRTGWGDSGGPVYTTVSGKLSVAGVISRTITIRSLDVYTDVGLHAAWIASIIAMP